MPNLYKFSYIYQDLISLGIGNSINYNKQTQNEINYTFKIYFHKFFIHLSGRNGAGENWSQGRIQRR